MNVRLMHTCTSASELLELSGRQGTTVNARTTVGGAKAWISRSEDREPGGGARVELLEHVDADSRASLDEVARESAIAESVEIFVKLPAEV